MHFLKALSQTLWAQAFLNPWCVYTAAFRRSLFQTTYSVNLLHLHMLQFPGLLLVRTTICCLPLLKLVPASFIWWSWCFSGWVSRLMKYSTTPTGFRASTVFHVVWSAHRKRLNRTQAYQNPRAPKVLNDTKNIRLKSHEAQSLLGQVFQVIQWSTNIEIWLTLVKISRKYSNEWN